MLAATICAYLLNGGFLMTAAQAPTPLQDPLDRKISFEMRAAPAKRVLPELSKVAGIRFEVSALTADDVLIIKVDDVSVKDLMAKIAEATASEWKQDKEVFRLIRGPKLQRQQIQGHFALREATVRAAQDAFRNELKELGPFDAATARQLGLELEAYVQAIRQDERVASQNNRQDALSRRHPTGRFARRIVAALDPIALANLEGSDSVVFSDRPNPMQRPLNSAAIQAIRDFIGELRIWEQAVPEIRGVWSITGMNPATPSEPSSERIPYKTIVKVDALPHYVGFSIAIYIMNSERKVWLRVGLPLNPVATRSTSSLESPDANEPDVSLSELSVQLSEAMKRLGRNRDQSFAISPALRDFLVHPEQHDLGELSLSDFVLALARPRKLDLVVAPIDVVSTIAGNLPANGMRKASQLMPYVQSSWLGMMAKQADGWMVAKPVDPYLARSLRLDRNALGDTLRAASAKGYLTLDELGQFALRAPRDPQATNLMTYLVMLAPDTAQSLPTYGWSLMRFHASLSAKQRRDLDSGRSIPISNLTPEQRSFINELIFGYYHLGVNFKRDATPELSSIEDLPTELFPNGIPPEASIKRSLRQTCKVATLLAEGGHSAMTLDYVAYMLFQAERPELFPNRESIEMGQYRASEETSIVYEFDMNQDVAFSKSLTEVGVPSPWVSAINQLPSKYQEMINKEILKLREQYKNQKPPPKQGD